MSLRKAAPGEGTRKGHVHFGYVSTPAGKTWDAWIAGPCYWCLCHTVGRSKPCLAWISAGELRCERCDSVKPPEEIGYLPLYRDVDGRPVFVIVHAYSRELVDRFRFRERVRIGRGTDSADAVTVQGMLGAKQWYSSTLKERQSEVDLTPTLLAVWKLPDLSAWYARQSDAATVARAAPVEPVKSDGEPFGPMTAAAAQKYSAPADDDGPSAETFDAVRERLRNRAESLKPSANGKHKPKG